MNHSDTNTLRHVRLELGYSLRTWNTGKLSAGRTCVGYELCDARGNAILRGVDFRPSPLHADDSDATLRALCGFLFLIVWATYAQRSILRDREDAAEELRDALRTAEDGGQPFEEVRP